MVENIRRELDVGTITTEGKHTVLGSCGDNHHECESEY